MRFTATMIVLGFVAATIGCAARRSPTSARVPQAPSEDLHFKLTTVGDVFVPGYLPRGVENVDLVVHFHGAPQVVEREFAPARLGA